MAAAALFPAQIVYVCELWIGAERHRMAFHAERIAYVRPEVGTRPALIRDLSSVIVQQP
jgi:hypothetical protein